MQPPEFWTHTNGVARILEPLGRIYGAVTSARADNAHAPRASIPVISVGGLTVGGAGKTPVTLSLTERLQDRGQKTAVVLRGYGGSLKGPVRVDADLHSSVDVGDEALLHVVQGPTWVARKRIEGVNAAAAAGATVAVLDDGHQHPGIHKDLRIVVIDGQNPWGNGYIFPAGPLRERVSRGLARTDAIVLMGEDRTDFAAQLPSHIPLLKASLVPDPLALSLRGQNVVAFAGIGNPEKFIATLREIGARIVAWHGFEDHQAFGAADIQPLLDEAFAMGALPVTTAKDAVRLSPDQRQQVNIVSVAVLWKDDAAVDANLSRTFRT
ncbi:MAG: tetraacyldisaccharide 4'-kinase [Rhodospirillaceae bacterium]|nr:tetraacyldisaccharide 4'-kinase [Rhodospirillaceae bacterium]